MKASIAIALAALLAGCAASPRIQVHYDKPLASHVVKRGPGGRIIEADPSPYVRHQLRHDPQPAE